ncbi:MAG: translation initiation factor IF-1 [Patescibacteria group bacterium]
MTETPKGTVVRATVVEALANAHFRISFETPPPDMTLGEDGTVIAYLAGKMRLHRIRVIVGDTVEVLLDSYGGKPRITRRL